MMQGYPLDIPIAVETVSTVFWIVTEYLSSSKEKEWEGIETQATHMHCIHCIYFIHCIRFATT